MRRYKAGMVYIRTSLLPQEVCARLREVTFPDEAFQVVSRRYRYQGVVSEEGFSLLEPAWDRQEFLFPKEKASCAVKGEIRAVQDGSLIAMSQWSGGAFYIFLAVMAAMFILFWLSGLAELRVLAVLMTTMGLFIASIPWRDQVDSADSICVLVDGERLRNERVARAICAAAGQPWPFPARSVRKHLDRAPFRIRTALSPQEVCTRIAGKLSAEQRAFSPPEAWYCGSVSPQGFRLHENPRLPSANLRALTGRVLPCEGGALIEIDRLKHRLLGFFIGAFAFIGALACICAVVADFAVALLFLIPALALPIALLLEMRHGWEKPFAARLCALVEGEFLLRAAKPGKEEKA